MALSGKVAAIYKESGPSTAFTDAATTSSAGYTRYSNPPSRFSAVTYKTKYG